MLKKSASENGSFNPRVFLAFVLASFGLMFGMISFASTPSSGTLSEATPVLNYTAGPFLQSNPVPVPLLQSGPTCTGAQPCDSYSLKVSLSATYANSGAAAKVTLSWNDTGSGSSDYDLYLYEGTVTNTSSGTPVASRSASSGNPEVASIFPLNPGDNTYTIKVVPYVATGETINVKIELLAGSGGASGFPGFGQADPTVPGQPRYQTFFPPSASNAESGSGEMNVGFNPKTGRFMLNNAGPVWRVTPPEVATAGAPECCEAKWEDRSSTIADKGVDPILWTDQTSGRTFASNFTGGANALYAYTDSDGEPTVTSPTGWVVLGAAVPNGSADHQTIGSGPYPSGSALANLANQGQAVYYCSQAVVGPATCQRSDDLGASYGPGTLAYTGSGCGGLHGHIRVGPDGTAYLPVPDCGGQAGVAVSTDAGITWKEFYLPNSLPQASGSDSSIAIDKDNNLYYFYIVSSTDRKQGTMHVQVGRKVLDATGQLIGITWSNDHDLGASQGIVNSAFPEAIAGDSGRAAVGFLGTDRPGDFQSLSFPGYWYAFMSTTFDGGKTWVTTNVSPNDPVQGKGGIWQQGGSATNRNLLDFNEITIDSKGRPGFAYSDGCVGECVGNPDANSFTAHMRLARQIGGRTLFASEDANTDTTVALLPEAPCLSGRRDQFATHLTWKAPDNGGSEITNYEVYRGTSPGGQKILLGNAGAK
ncbi:MAG: exo-alpha-sialidase, partial [Pyrinomonadaceae bacterium]|nr:exo-alpha-sialidase [Pyrinomonadaceae bacterium]